MRGQGIRSSCDPSDREKLIHEVIPAYMDAKREGGQIDWSDLALLSAEAEPNRLYDMVVVDEAQDDGSTG